MNSITFQEFTNNNPNWMQEAGVWQRDSSVYQRLTGAWEETRAGGRKLSHATCPVIDVRTGELWLDCRPSLIAVKHAVQIPARVLHTAVKTAYHASIIIPLISSVQQYRKNEISLGGVIRFNARSLVDIVRTPAYGVAMIVVHVIALPLGLIASKTLYHTRAAIGWLERSLVWNEGRVLKQHFSQSLSQGGIAMCFSPVRTFGDLRIRTTPDNTPKAERKHKSIETAADLRLRAQQSCKRHVLLVRETMDEQRIRGSSPCARKFWIDTRKKPYRSPALDGFSR